MATKKTVTATKPERLVALVGGESGTGKSFFCACLRNALIFDTDVGGGLSAYDARIARNNSERIEVGSYQDVMRVLKDRRKELAGITTLVIDHLTTLQHEAVQRHNPQGAEDFGKSYNKATREWQTIRNLVRTGDFNLVCTAHMKSKYANQKVVGVTTDASKNVEADMMVVLYLEKGYGHPSTAHVAKWRRDPEDARGLVPADFPFTLERFLDIHGFPLEAQREEVQMASPEEVAQLEGLIETVKLPEGTADKWLSAAKAEEWADLTGEQIRKCIGVLNDKVRLANSGR